MGTKSEDLGVDPWKKAARNRKWGREDEDGGSLENRTSCAQLLFASVCAVSWLLYVSIHSVAFCISGYGCGGLTNQTWNMWTTLSSNWIELSHILDHQFQHFHQACVSSLVFTGFVHADPHAGNLILTDDGRLAFLDFGLMGASPLPTNQPKTATNWRGFLLNVFAMFVIFFVFLISIDFSCSFCVEFQCLVLNSLFRRGQFIDVSLFYFIIVPAFLIWNLTAKELWSLISWKALQFLGFGNLADPQRLWLENRRIECCLMLFDAVCVCLHPVRTSPCPKNRLFFSSYFRLTGWHPTSPRREMALAGKGHARPHSSKSVRSQFGNLFTKFILNLSATYRHFRHHRSHRKQKALRHWTCDEHQLHCRCWLHGGRGRGRL